MSARDSRTWPRRTMVSLLMLASMIVLGSTATDVQAMRIDDGGPAREAARPFVPNAPDADVSLGNIVFRDLDNDGLYDPGSGESGIPAVLLNLYRDDGNVAGSLDVGDTLVTSSNTVGGGAYSFTGLDDGEYIVEVDPLNFGPGGALTGLISAYGNDPAPDPDDDVDGDDNGADVLGFGVASSAIELVSGTEPIDDGDTDSDTNLSLDFGFTCELCVGDLVFEDLNDDGAFDDLTEVGIENVTVHLYRDADADGLRSAGDAFVASTSTDVDGYYIFCGLGAGEYVVEVVASDFQSGAVLEHYRSSTGNDPAPDPDDDIDDDDNGAEVSGFGVASRALTLLCGSEPDKDDDGDGTDSNLTVDLGFVPTLSLGDRIFKDQNFDAVYDPGDGDSGIALVLVNLYEDTNNDGVLSLGDTLIASTNSVAGGSYLFTGLEPGDYIVEADPINFDPGGVLNGTLTSGANEVGGLAPDPDDDVNDDDNGYAVSGFGIASQAVTLDRRTEPDTDGDSDTDTNLALDMGFVCNLCVGDTIFRDTNDDGVFDDGTEAGIEAVTVNLYRDADNDGLRSPGDELVDSMETGPDGDYLFCGLTADDYVVEIDPSEFEAGGSLLGLVSSSGNDPAPDPDDDVDDDDNGSAALLSGSLVIATQAVTLACGLEPDKPVDADNTDSNRTVDLGLTPASPSIELQKTVYQGHDAGAGCPGGELVTKFNGNPVTYCFEVTNTGDTYLDDVSIDDLDLGLDETDLTPLGGAVFPLAPGASATWYYETIIDGDLLNTADVSANPTDDQGRDLPGLTDPTDSDTAEVEGIVPGTPFVSVDKVVDSPTVYASETVTYTYTVGNPGDTLLSNVVVDDDRCAPVLGPDPSGDANNNGWLDPGETWVYSCSQALPVDTTNTVLVTATPIDDEGDPIPGRPPVNDEDSASVDVINPDIELIKRAIPDRVLPGDPVRYVFIVSNPGDDPLANVVLSDNTCSPVVGPQAGGDANGDGLLDPGETWLYECSASLSQDTLNLANVAGEDSLGAPVEDQDTAFVDVIIVGLDLEKQADATTVYSGTLVTYTYTVRNTGTEPASQVLVSDDQCAPVVGPDPAGDSNNDGLLDPGEVWEYSCSQTLSEDTLNVATVTAEDPLGNAVPPAQDTEDVDVIHPDIQVLKAASPEVVLADGAVTYSYVVTNSGDDPLANVSLSDDTCGPISGPQAGGDANNDGLLDPSEVWLFSCADNLATDTTNTVVATGDDSLGGPVEDQDMAFVDVVNPSVLLQKVASETIVYVGDLVSFELSATNTGDVPLAPVGVTDDRCSPLLGPDPSGDLNNNGLLDPGETWVYTCSQNLDVDQVNTGEATFNPVDDNGTDLPGIPNVSDDDTAEVDVIDPSVELDKSVDQPTITPGDLVTYSFELTNTGDDPLSNVGITDDTCSPISGPDPAGDLNSNGLLDPGETWVYTCTAMPVGDTVNVASGGGEDSLGNPVSDTDSELVDALDIDLTLQKLVDRTVIDPGDVVTYTFLAGNIGGAAAYNVVVSDDRCAPVIGPDPSGDTNNNGLLDPGEVWEYTCSTALTEDTFNTATITGEDQLGNPQEPDIDSADVDVINPDIRVVKAAEPTVTLSGGAVSYTYAVTNPGDDPLSDVALSDDTCGPVSGPNPAGDLNGNGLLDPGEVWEYSCSTNVVGDTLNTVEASGRDSLDRPVSDEDTAFVDVVAPALTVEKTVSTGGQCPGSDNLQVPSGTVVSYCYAITNSGDTYLSEIIVADDVLGPICTIFGPLAPGATETCIRTATIDADVTNVVIAVGNPTDSIGRDLPDIPAPQDDDSASVALVLPSITLEKTVYSGHDAGASCPGADLLLGVAGEALTWCFAVSNIGDTFLADPQITDLDLGISQAQLTLLSGSLPLAPGATARWYYEGELLQNRINLARVTANPSDGGGADLPGLPDVSDEDTAEVVRTSTLGDRIFYDLDNDGVFEPATGEIGLDNVLVNLYRDDGTTPGELDANDTQIGSVLTAGGGLYEFRLLRDGDYIVQVDATNFALAGPLPLAISSFGAGPPSDPDDDVDDDDNGAEDLLGGVSTAAVTIVAGTEPVSEDADPDTNLSLDLGFVGSGSIGDQVWLDEDENGIPDPGEGIPNVTVQLRGTISGVPFVYTTTTDPDGNYLFENLFGGVYQVTVLANTLPPAVVPSYDMDGIQTPNTTSVELLSGEITLLADFAYQISQFGETSRAKLFYDPADGDDLYVNERGPNNLPTLRLYGQTAVCDPLARAPGNLPVTAGSNAATDTTTLLVPEDPPYSDPEGPFSPNSTEAPEADYVTWNPAWISERLDDPDLMDGWGCANGLDEVSAASNIRAGGVNASEKVWLRSWYEPTHLDKDLNADSCLTDNSGAPDGGPDGIPDAPMNPTPTNIDEWYPAIMTELTYMLVENAPLPQPDPAPSDLHRSAPRPTCGAPGPGTRIVFPVGTDLSETNDAGPLQGFGLTSLDVDFDGQNDMVTVSDEVNLPGVIGGTTIDFDGDGVVDPLDGDRALGTGALSCDELAVLHTDAVTIGLGDVAQFLDHFVRVSAVTSSGVLLEIVYSGDLQTRPFNPLLVGNGATALAGDIGPAQIITAGGNNLGQVPVGPWFVHVVDSDPDNDTAIVVLGRALGAPCASMEDGPNQANLQPGSPYFLKRFYVDGHEYNVTAIMTCDTGGFQYLTLRAPLPKVPVTIEQHSVRLQPYAPLDRLVLPPPFNHEHTILEDIVALDDFGACPVLPLDGQPVDRPQILYSGGPIGPVPPVLSNADSLPYTGRSPNTPVGPYTDTLASSWFYVLEDVNPGLAGQLREKYGAVDTSSPDCPTPAGVPDAFFYNEQVLSAPYSFTEFHMPELDDPTEPGTGDTLCDPDSYLVTSNMIDPNARLRRWRMPEAGVPAQVPPSPPDLIADYSGPDPATGQYGVPNRASFEFDPDQPEKMVAGSDGIRLYGGFADCEDADCDGAGSRPSILNGAGDITALGDPVTGAPVEVLPYTDPFAPFNPQHPDAPRSDSLTFNPAFLSEFQNSGEDLAVLYGRIANNGQNALQKVYHRMWYQPDYITKLRFTDDCSRDIAFPALVQEYTFLPLDTTINPRAMPPGTSQLAFPMATRAEELPLPGTNPAGSGFGYGLTTFDADFDGNPDAVKIHDEATLNTYLDQTWQAVRPTVPGFPPAPIPGPELDFDGDGTSDDSLDEDCVALNGNEMVVLAVESVVLDADAGTPNIGPDVMFLDHMARVTNVTGGSFPRAQLAIRYTGGGPADARPQLVPGGLISLDVGDAIVVDHLGGGVRRVQPGQNNLGGLDGAWFLFVEAVDPDGDVVVVTVGRALGASHSAIDDGFGGHDLAPGDPWYLKRFYVDGHEYNVVALMTRSAAGADPLDPAECNSDFGFLTIRTPVPKGLLSGDQFNNQDSLFQQGYFLDGLPAEMSVLPPFNVDHTIAVDIERIEPSSFDDPDSFGQCTGPIRPAGPLTERITAEEREPRRATELRETYSISRTLGTTPAWETHQTIAAAAGYTEIALPQDQTYMLTMSWRTRDTRLSFYGCTPIEAGPFDEDNPPPLTQDDIQAVADCWRDGIVPDDEDRPAPYVGPRVGGDYDNLPGPGIPPVPPPPPPAGGTDLRLEKTALTQTPVAGTQLAYLIEVFNDGPDPASTLLVTDTLPVGLSYVGDTTGGACTLVSTPPDTLRCAFDDLAVGDSILFAVFAFVDAGVPPGTPLVNMATVELGATQIMALAEDGTVDGEPPRLLSEGDPNRANNADSTTVFVVAESNLGLSTASTTPDPVVAGEVFTSSFRVGNAGPSDAPALRLTLEIPAGTSYAGSQGAACSGVPMGGTGVLTCDRGTLPLGGEAFIEIALRVDPSVDPNTRIQLVPSASAPGATDPDPADDPAMSEVKSIAETDLSVEKLGPATVQPGERFDWTIRLRNAGPSDARGVTLIERLPAELSLVDSHGLSCEEGPDQTFRCALGRVAAGEERNLRLTVELDDAVEGGSLDGGSTEAVSDTTERDPSDNEAVGIEVQVLREADLSLMLDAMNTASPGGTLDWRLKVANQGPTAAAGVRVELSLPSGLAFVDQADGCAETLQGSGQVVCELGAISLGQVPKVVLRTRVDDAIAKSEILELVATVFAISNDPNPANDVASASVVVEPRADLAVGLEPLGGPAVAGEALAYAMVLENLGPSPAEAVSFVSQLPAGANYIGDDGGCSQSNAWLSCPVGDLPAGGAPLRIEVELSLDAALMDGTIVRLHAAATTRTPDQRLANNVAVASVEVGAVSDLRLEPALDERTETAGESFSVAYQLTNDGPSVAREVFLSERWPEGLQLLELPAGCILESDQLRCAMGDLTPGQSQQLNLDLTLKPDRVEGEILESSAELSSTTSDTDSSNNLSTRRVLVTTSADLGLRKDGPVWAEPGEPITYRLTVTNAGPSDARGLRLTDRLPEGFDFKQASSPACVEELGLVECELGELPAGEALEIEIDGSLASDLAEGMELLNEAELSASTPDPDASNDAAAWTTTLRLADEADLALALVASETEPAAGTEINLRAMAANAGPRLAPDAALVLRLPSGLSYVGEAAGCAMEPDQQLRCELGTLGVGQTAQRDLVMVLAAEAVEGTILRAEAVVEADRPDPQAANDEAAVEITVGRRADLALSLEAEPAGDDTVAGEGLDYTMRVENLGPSASEAAELILTLPTGVRYLADDSGCDVGDLPLLRCLTPAMDSSGEAMVRVEVLLEPSLSHGATLVTSAQVRGDADSEPGNDRSTSEIEVVRRADLRLAKTASRAEVMPGEALSYTLRIENLGPSDASAVSLRDRLPQGLIYTGDDAGCLIGELPELSCALGRIEAGASLELQVAAEVASNQVPGSLTNEAELSSGSLDPNMDNNLAQAAVRVGAMIDLSLNLSATGERLRSGEPPSLADVAGVVTAGRDLTYTIELRNAGPATATEIILRIDLPEGLRLLEGAAPICDDADAPRLRCALGALDAGATRVVELEFAVAPEIEEGVVLEAEAEVSAAETDLRADDDRASQVTRVEARSDLSISLQVDPERPLPGEALRLVADYVAAGPSLARDAKLDFELPPGFELNAEPEGCRLEASGLLRCMLGDLPPGAAGDLELVARSAPDPVEGEKLAAVTISNDTQDPDGSNDRAEASFALDPVADLSLDLVGFGQSIERAEPPRRLELPDRVAAGLQLRYRLTASNAGPAQAVDPQVSLSLPHGLSLVEAPEGCRLAALPAIVCELPALAAGEQASLELIATLDVSAKPGSELMAEARLVASTLDPAEENNVARHQARVEGWADLAIGAEIDPSIVRPGGIISLSIAAANVGPGVAEGVAMLVSLPAGLVVTQAPEGCQPLGEAGTAWRCALPALMPGEPVARRLDLHVQSASGGELELAVAIAADTSDPQSSNNTARAGVRVSLSADPQEPTPTPDPGQATPQPTPDLRAEPSTIFLPVVKRAD